MLDKALAAEPPEELFPQLAVPETDLRNVHGAYDVSVVDPDEISELGDPDGELAERAEVLRDAFLAVRGVADSPVFTAVVGYEGAEVGVLSIKPVARGDHFDLDVRYAGTPSCEPRARQVRDAIGDGDRSLFAWVAATCTDGWLVCDDGAGEVARNSSPDREVAVTAYQEVAAQAVKVRARHFGPRARPSSRSGTT